MGMNGVRRGCGWGWNGHVKVDGVGMEASATGMEVNEVEIGVDWVGTHTGEAPEYRRQRFDYKC